MHIVIQKHTYTTIWFQVKQHAIKPLTCHETQGQRAYSSTLPTPQSDVGTVTFASTTLPAQFLYKILNIYVPQRQG